MTNFVYIGNRGSMTSTIAYYTLKFSDIFSHITGWVMAIGIFFADIFAGHSFIMGIVVVVTALDAIWGIAVSIKMGGFALSELLRMTVGKLAVYGCALFSFFALDAYIHTQIDIEMTLTTAIIGALIVLTETWSSIASMLILFPELPFLRLMEKALTGEIARKLQIPEEDVKEVLSSEDYLKNLKKKKKPHSRVKKTPERGPEQKD